MEKSEDGERLIAVTQIWARLYLGGLQDAERLGTANPIGITTVVSLGEDAPRNTRRKIKYIHLPVEDAQEIPASQLDAIIDAIAEHIRRGKVLVHCGGGISRAPSMTAAWMHVVGYKNFDAALEEIAGLRPVIAPSAVLLASVRAHLL